MLCARCECAPDVDVKMKTSSAAVAAIMLLVAAVVAQSDGAPAPSTLTSLRSAVNHMAHLPDDGDTVIRLQSPSAGMLDDYDSENSWIPERVGTDKRAEWKRRSGRRRYDAYGVAGRFGR